MFPVHMKTKGSEPPSTVPHYIVAKNGLFLKKANWWMEAIVPVKQIAVLEEQATGITLKLPSLSAVMLMKVWKFFKVVFDKHHSESAVLLHYSQTLGWELTVPEQTVSFSHVDYKMIERLEGYVLMGTMHSHSSMSAFHSGTDIGDEAQVDGVHITFGHLNDIDRFSMDAEVVVNGSRFKLPLKLLEGVSVAEAKTSTFTTYLSPHLSVDQQYTITCSQVDGWEVPDDWMKKVTKTTLTQTYAECSDWNWGVAMGDPLLGIGSTLGLTNLPARKVAREVKPKITAVRKEVKP